MHENVQRVHDGGHVHDDGGHVHDGGGHVHVHGGHVHDGDGDDRDHDDDDGDYRVRPCTSQLRSEPHVACDTLPEPVAIDVSHLLATSMPTQIGFRLQIESI